MNKLILMIIFILNVSIGVSQDAFFTKNAFLSVKTEYNGEAVELYTRDLIIKLNYETAFITIKIPVKSLIADNLEIQEKIKVSQTEILFSGYLGINFINTEQHPPFKFDFNGQLNIGDYYSLIEGMGELIHIERANRFVCMLGLKWVLNLNDLEIFDQLSDFGDYFEIAVTYPILERDGF